MKERKTTFKLYIQLTILDLNVHCENIQSFNPTTCISSKVRRIERATSSIFRKHLLPFKITESQLSVLFVLSKRDGLTQKQLSDFAHLEKSTINRNLARLLSSNCITRKDFPQIKLTETGRLFVENIIPIWNNAMIEIGEILSTEGIEALNIIDQKINKLNKHVVKYRLYRAFGSNDTNHP
jgi:DNA-binding MarR family transcriptional regulator